MAIVLDGSAGITTPDLTDTSLTSGRVVYAGTSGNLTGSSAFTFDGAYLGLGVTPSAWASGSKGLQILKAGLYHDNQEYLSLVNNAYYDGSNWKYLSNSYSSQIVQILGESRFYNAPVGTTGNNVTFTQAMTLNAVGNLGVGTTSPVSRLAVVDAGNTFSTTVGGAGGTQIVCLGNSVGVPVVQGYTAGFGAVTDLGLQTSGGNLLVGTTSTAFSTRMLVAQPTSSSSSIAAWNSATSGDNSLITFFTDGGSGRGSITYNRGAGVVAYNVTSDYRAKDIYGPIPDSGALIDSVPVYMGKMKGATQERPMFIAHETPAYAHTGEKDAVDKDGNPVYQQMDASSLVPVMWAEIQSLRTRLTALENK